jgi:hypothetical protein
MYPMHFSQPDSPPDYFLQLHNTIAQEASVFIGTINRHVIDFEPLSAAKIALERYNDPANAQFRDLTHHELGIDVPYTETVYKARIMTTNGYHYPLWASYRVSHESFKVCEEAVEFWELIALLTGHPLPPEPLEHSGLIITLEEAKQEELDLMYHLAHEAFCQDAGLQSLCKTLLLIIDTYLYPLVLKAMIHAILEGSQKTITRQSRGDSEHFDKRWSEILTIAEVSNDTFNKRWEAADRRAHTLVQFGLGSMNEPAGMLSKAFEKHSFDSSLPKFCMLFAEQLSELAT